MITDALNTMFTPGSANAALAVGAVGTPVISDIIDLGPVYGGFRDIAAGQKLLLRIQIETTAASGGAATLSVSYGDSPNPDGSAGTIRYTSPAPVALANLAQGYVLVDIGLPDNFQRYLYTTFTVGGAVFTAGMIRSTILEQSDTQPPGNVYTTNTPSTGF